MYKNYTFDEDYVQRLKTGDGDTEDHFFKYFGELIRIKAASRMRSGNGPAEDIRQETLFRVLRTIRQRGIDHPERLGAFVNTVCNNVMLETFRRDKRLNQFSEEAPEIASKESSAEAGMLQDERRELVRNALDQLAQKDQDLLRGIFLEERDKDLVCKEFHVSRDYLRVLLHRARNRLRSSLDGSRGPMPSA